LQPGDAHSVEFHQANPQAAPPQPRSAAGGSNSSHTSLNRPVCETTFQEPANAGYESYFSECHPVYVDKPESFFSGQELKPELYKLVIKKSSAIQLNLPPSVDFENPVVNHQPKIDLVPHILADGLGISGSCNKCVFKCLLDSGRTNPIINWKCIPDSFNLMHAKTSSLR
jgi:hypothetical protein